MDLETLSKKYDSWLSATPPLSLKTITELIFYRTLTDCNHDPALTGEALGMQVRLVYKKIKKLREEGKISEQSNNSVA